MPETIRKKTILPTGQEQIEIEHFIKKYKDSIVELDANSLLNIIKMTATNILASYITASSVYANYFSLNTVSQENTNIIGSIYFDEQDGVPTAVLENSRLQIGKEMYIDGLNNTGTTISNGEVVFVSGASGNRMTIDLSDANNYEASHKTIGMATHDIANNVNGNVTTFGLVRDLDTSEFSEGDQLFLSETAGAYTTVTPSFGIGRWHIGIVNKSHAQDGEIFIDVHEDKYMFGDVDGGNYSGFEDDGTLKCVGNATTWEDLQFQVSSGKVPAANFPSYEALTTNTQAYAFSVNDYIDLAANEPPHSHEINSTGSFHVHVTPKVGNATGSDRFVKIQIIISYAAVGSVWDETTLSAELTIPTGTPAKKHFLLSLGGFDLTGMGIGGQIGLQLKRIAATGGTEFADDVFLTQVGLHYKQDTMGSRETAAK